MPRLGKSWRSRLSVTSFVLVFLYTAVLPAEGMKILPEWTRMKGCVITQEDTPDLFACYDFESAKKLKTLDLDLHLKYQQFSLGEAVKLELRASVGSLKAALAKERASASLLKKRLDSKQTNLRGMADMYIAADKRDILGGALPWAIAGAVLFFVGGLVTGFFAAK